MREKINLDIDANIYKKFQTALKWFGVDETAILDKFMEDYSNSFIKSFLGLSSPDESQKAETSNAKPCEGKSEVNVKAKSTILTTASNADDRRKLFVEWFGTQERNGKPYSSRTIELYANKLANACKNQAFDQIPVNNLFEISDYAEFKTLKAKIENSPKFAEFCKKTPGLFSSALSKYSEFLECVEKN